MQLESHLVTRSPMRQLLESLPMLFKAVRFIANTSAEYGKMSARSSALINSAHRAL